LYDEQEAAIYDDARFVWIEASTKSGKTAGCIVWQLDHVFSDQHAREHWWVAPVYSQAKIAFRRAKRMLIEADLKGEFSANGSTLTIEFENGARWCFKSGEKPDNLYGEDVATVVLDEASRMREESWHAVRSTLTATRGVCRAIGNVKGRGNWFYRMARKAESGADGHAYHKLTAYDAVDGGVLDAREIEQAKADLPDHVFRELYLAEPADDGGNPFGQDAIESRIIPALSDREPVAWGWDLAKSVDWTVGIGIDDVGDVCRFERFQKPWRDTIRVIERETHAPAYVDSTGVGDPVMEQLESRHCEGFKFTSRSKQQIMEGLAVAIQSGEVGYPDNAIASELRIFEYEYYRSGVRYSAPSGMHDDCVCALALAVHRKNSMPSKVAMVL
jgi:hypothetical protein